VRLVFLALLDRAVLRFEIVVAREALAHLPPQVAVRHRMAHGRRLLAQLTQDLVHAPRGLALATPGAHRADGDHGLRRTEHRGLRREHPEICPGRVDPRRLVHDLDVRQIGVRHAAFSNAVSLDQLIELALGMDRDAFRVQLARQLRRIAAIIDVRDLRCGEGHDPMAAVGAVDPVEIVKIAPGGAQDDRGDRFPLRHGSSSEPTAQTLPLCRRRLGRRIATASSTGKGTNGMLLPGRSR